MTAMYTPQKTYQDIILLSNSKDYRQKYYISTYAAARRKAMSIKARAIIISAVIAVITAASVLCIIYMHNTADNGAYAYIYQNDKIIRTIDLTNIDEPYRITIETEDGGYNVIEVRQGSIGVVEASCPDGLCMNMGFIENSLMPVTCLPNHLVIKVIDEEAQELDGVIY